MSVNKLFFALRKKMQKWNKKIVYNLNLFLDFCSPAEAAWI